MQFDHGTWDSGRMDGQAEDEAGLGRGDIRTYADNCRILLRNWILGR